MSRGSEQTKKKRRKERVWLVKLGGTGAGILGMCLPDLQLAFSFYLPSLHSLSINNLVVRLRTIQPRSIHIRRELACDYSTSPGLRLRRRRACSDEDLSIEASTDLPSHLHLHRQLSTSRIWQHKRPSTRALVRRCRPRARSRATMSCTICC